MRRRTFTILLLAPLALVACSPSGGEDSPQDDDTATSASAASADGTDASGIDDLAGEIPFAVGDCWGLEDDVELDPIPCDGPHIYEVIGIVEEWDYEQYEGGFDEGVAGDEAMMEACDEQAAAYFGYDPVDEGIMIAHGEPKFWGHEDVVFCSAHSGPDVEFVGDEVEGSFADRGWR